MSDTNPFTEELMLEYLAGWSSAELQQVIVGPIININLSYSKVYEFAHSSKKQEFLKAMVNFLSGNSYRGFNYIPIIAAVKDLEMETIDLIIKQISYLTEEDTNKQATLQMIAENSSCNLQHLTFAGQHANSPDTLTHIVKQLQTKFKDKPEFREEFASLLRTLANNPNATVEHLKFVIENTTDPIIIGLVINHQNGTAIDASILKAIANHVNATSNHLEFVIAHTEEIEVLESVIKHKNIVPHVFTPDKLAFIAEHTQEPTVLNLVVQAANANAKIDDAVLKSIAYNQQATITHLNFVKDNVQHFKHDATLIAHTQNQLQKHHNTTALLAAYSSVDAINKAYKKKRGFWSFLWPLAPEREGQINNLHTKINDLKNNTELSINQKFEQLNIVLLALQAELDPEKKHNKNSALRALIDQMLNNLNNAVAANSLTPAAIVSSASDANVGNENIRTKAQIKAAHTVLQDQRGSKMVVADGLHRLPNKLTDPAQTQINPSRLNKPHS